MIWLKSLGRGISFILDRLREIDDRNAHFLIFLVLSLFFLNQNQDLIRRFTLDRDISVLNDHSYGWPLTIYREGGLLGGFGFDPMNLILNYAILGVTFFLLVALFDIRKRLADYARKLGDLIFSLDRTN